MIVYALIGKSGSGKSHRAQNVSRDYDIGFIIDDGILINGNRVIAGKSAKKEETRIAAVKRAIFTDYDHIAEVQSAIESSNPGSILVIGTSDNMVNRICHNLKLPLPSKKIYIEEIATQREIETATRTRKEQGKHVIPVPTFAVKKDFSGYFIDSMKNFGRKGKEVEEDGIEKTVVRPTFSYLGKYMISVSAIKSIISFAGEKIEGVHKILKINAENGNRGLKVSLEVIVDYGYNIYEVVNSMRENIKREIEYMTAFNILGINVEVKGLNIDKRKK